MGTAKWKGGEVKPLARIDWRGWDAEHNHAFQITALNANRLHGIASLEDPVARARLYDNRPAPRRASCHYLSVDADPRNVYFY